MEFKRQDHYKDLYATVMDHRQQMEGFLNRYGVKW
jgi:myo-inositol catabolism protein IolC